MDAKIFEIETPEGIKFKVKYDTPDTLLEDAPTCDTYEEALNLKWLLNEPLDF